MKSFNIEDGKVIMNTIPVYGWLRKEDVMCEIYSLLEIYENKLKSYDENNAKDRDMYYETNGQILALKVLLEKIKKS